MKLRTGNVYSLEYSKFQIFSLRHFTGDDVIGATKGMSNATVVLKATMLSKVTVETAWSKVIVVTL
jgi:hypothetical protein